MGCSGLYPGKSQKICRIGYYTASAGRLLLLWSRDHGHETQEQPSGTPLISSCQPDTNVGSLANDMRPHAADCY